MGVVLAVRLLRFASQIEPHLLNEHSWWYMPKYTVWQDLQAEGVAKGECVITGHALPERNPALDEKNALQRPSKQGRFLVNGRLDGTTLPDGRTMIDNVVTWDDALDWNLFSKGDADSSTSLPKRHQQELRSSFDRADIMEYAFTAG